MALEVPAVIAAKRSRRPIGVKAAAEMKRHTPASERSGAVQPSTPREAERGAPQHPLPSSPSGGRVRGSFRPTCWPTRRKSTGAAAMPPTLFHEIPHRIHEER